MDNQLIRNDHPGPVGFSPDRRGFTPPAVIHHQAAPAGPGLLSSYLRTLARERWRVILFAVLGALIGLLITLPQKPMYLARTSLDIQSLNENFMNMHAVDPSGASGNYTAESNLQTHMRLLQSEVLLERVVRKMQTESNASVPNRDLLSRVASALRIEKDPSTPRAELINATARTLKVKPIGLTRLIEVDCESSDPAIAANFCNTLAKEYLDQDYEIRAETAQETNEWLTRQLSDVRMKLEGAEARLLGYARDNKILFNQETDSVNQEKLRQDQLELSRAEADRVTKQSTNDLLNSANADSLPPVLDNGPLTGYQEKLTDLLRQRAELSAALTPSHPKVLKIQAQIDELRASIEREKANVLARIRNEFTAAKSRENLLKLGYQKQEDVVAGEVAKAAQFKLLRQDVESERGIYESLMQRVREAGLVSMMRTKPLRVVDPAQMPRRPFSPNRILTSGLGLLFGSLFGIGFVFWFERSTPKLRAPGDSRERLHLRELGVIPSSRVDGMIRSGTRLELITQNNERSLLAESYRSTMNSILFNTQGGARSNVIVVSSPHLGEGKTSLTCNLGIALAETKRRVLLIDGDMRRPRLHQVFDLPNEFGLSDLLSGDIPIESLATEALVQRASVKNLAVITSGAQSALNISMLLHGEYLDQLLRRVRRDFDVILIDTPPLLHISDARVIAKHASGVVLVLRAGSTSMEAATAAYQILAQDELRIIGTVLNDFNPASEARYGYYKSYYAQKA